MYIMPEFSSCSSHIHTHPHVYSAVVQLLCYLHSGGHPNQELLFLMNCYSHAECYDKPASQSDCSVGLGLSTKLIFMQLASDL